MQVGYAGLIAAINRFDPAFGCSLATYARSAISARACSARTSAPRDDKPGETGGPHASCRLLSAPGQAKCQFAGSGGLS